MLSDLYWFGDDAYEGQGEGDEEYGRLNTEYLVNNYTYGVNSIFNVIQGYDPDYSFTDGWYVPSIGEIINILQSLYAEIIVEINNPTRRQIWTSNTSTLDSTGKCVVFHDVNDPVINPGDFDAPFLFIPIRRIIIP